ncbi:hypothetical protein D3C72_1418570 [compost metagenome]
MQQDFNMILGPLLGFLFTAGTLLFVALNAHRTVAAVPGTDGVTEPVVATAAAEPVTPAEPAPTTPAEAPASEPTREGT